MDVYPQRKPMTMDNVAIVLGGISIASCFLLYISIPVGALAIIIGVLSRGGEMTFTRNAKVGITLGALGLFITITFYVSACLYLFKTYGSIEGILQAYADLLGISYEDVLEMFSLQ